MRPELFTTYSRQTREGKEHLLSVFLGSEKASLDEFDAALAKELQSVGQLDAIHFVGYQEALELLRQWLAQPGALLLDRIQGVLGNRLEESLRLISFDQTAAKHIATYRDGRPIADAELIDAERRSSLLKIFISSGGEEVSPAGTHYAKTSEKHTDRFLRVSNVLERGSHVQLIAYWLAPKLWRSAVRHLVVDTSGIYSVAYAALHEISRRGGMVEPPQVWSHRSHEGLVDIPRHVAEDSIFLVSASTSNGLVSRLVNEIGARPDHVVTLFGFSGADIPEHFLLCDLRGDGESGVRPIQNQDAASCSLCKRHFHLINIRGDQFSISPPRVSSIEIKAEDLADKERGVLAAISGLRAFFAYRRRDGERLATLGLDVTPLLADPVYEKCQAFQTKVQDKWRSYVRRSQTVSLRSVVAASYPGSDHLANEIGQQAQQALSDKNAARVVDVPTLRTLDPRGGHIDRCGFCLCG